MTNTIDEDYALVAANRTPSAGLPKPHGAGALGVLLVFGLMVGASAVYERANAPQAQAERSALVAQIKEQQADIARRQDVATRLEARIGALQGSVDTDAARGEDLLTTLRQSRILSGATSVTGPGVRVTVNDAPDAQPGGEGEVLDSDLQLLVNGMWQSGAEAISINGHRLSPLSAIRTAGVAITVNFRSLSPPYIVNVIGNPDTLQATFVETAAGQAWLDLQTNFSLGFDMASRQSLTLPAAPRVDVTYAQRQGELP